MRITKSQKLILYSLGHFYQSVNQPLLDKHLKLRVSKITFIELLLDSKLIHQQKRAIYKNLESLEEKKLIEYDKRMIKFTNTGLIELTKINTEINTFIEIENYFHKKKKQENKNKTSRKLQTIIEN